MGVASWWFYYIDIISYRYWRKIFIINFKAIFIFKIEHIYAIEKGLAGEQSALADFLNVAIES
jgi:hypothetical protein